MVRCTTFAGSYTWPALVGELVAAVLVRAAIATALTALAWPPGVARPPLWTLVASANRPVIFLAGYDSTFPGGSNGKDQSVRFSYRGTDAQGQPMPYAAEDTHQSLIVSAGLLADQVDEVHRHTGKPIALVGESEGSLIARYYLSHRPHPAVDTAILTSPIVRAGRTYHPPPEAGSGWGIGTGWLLRGLLAFLIGRSVIPPGRWDYSIVHRVAGAWQAPALALSLNPAWHNGPLPDASFERRACPD